MDLKAILGIKSKKKKKKGKGRDDKVGARKYLKINPKGPLHNVVKLRKRQEDALNGKG